jgi:hypothetical protein
MSNPTPEQLNEYASHAMMLMGRAFIKAYNDSVTANKKYIQDDHAKRYWDEIKFVGFAEHMITNTMKFMDVFTGLFGNTSGISINDYLAGLSKMQPRGFGEWVKPSLIQNVPLKNVQNLINTRYGQIDVDKKYSNTSLKVTSVTAETKQEAAVTKQEKVSSESKPVRQEYVIKNPFASILPPPPMNVPWYRSSIMIFVLMLLSLFTFIVIILLLVFSRTR